MNQTTTITVPTDMAPIIVAVLTALAKAEQKFGPIHSALEGWAVIREETDELTDALVALRDRIEGSMWKAVKSDNYTDVMSEAHHVAAMALRFLKDVTVCSGTKWRGGERGAMSEAANLASDANRQGAQVAGAMSSGSGAPGVSDPSHLKMNVHIDGRKVAEAVAMSLDDPRAEIEGLRAMLRESDRNLEHAKRANDLMREERDAAQAAVRREREESREVFAKYSAEIERVAKERDDLQRSLRNERRTMEMIHAIAAGDVTPLKLEPSMVMGRGGIAAAIAEAMRRQGVAG